MKACDGIVGGGRTGYAVGRGSIARGRRGTLTSGRARRGRLRTTRTSPNSSEIYSTGQRLKDEDGACGTTSGGNESSRRADGVDEDEEDDRIDTVGRTKRVPCKLTTRSYASRRCASERDG